MPAYNTIVVSTLFIGLVLQLKTTDANPLPSIASDEQSKPQLDPIVKQIAQQQLLSLPSQSPPLQPQLQQVVAANVPESMSQSPAVVKTQLVAPIVKVVRMPGATAEKLKRGLTNFMNQLNPGPYFVPATPVNAHSQAKSQAEPAAIVNGDPTAEALIKGPNRLTQTRPIGGPLRWGRRR